MYVGKGVSELRRLTAIESLPELPQGLRAFVTGFTQRFFVMQHLAEVFERFRKFSLKMEMTRGIEERVLSGEAAIENAPPIRRKL